MSLQAHLIHRCDIERATKLNDPYQNAKLSWTTQAEDVPCRLVASAQRIISTDRTQFTVVSTFKLLLPLGTDVIEDDRITNIVDVDGGPFTVKAVLARRSRAVHHITLELERVT